MTSILKATIIILGGALTLMFTALALRNASLTDAIQAVTALAVSLTLYQRISGAQNLSKTQVSRNQKQLVIGLIIGLLVPALALWIIVYKAHHP